MRFPVIDYRIVVVDVVVVVTDTSSVGIWYDGGWSSRFCCDNINTSDDERNITMGVQCVSVIKLQSCMTCISKCFDPVVAVIKGT